MSASEGKHVDELTMMRLAEGELARDREDVTRNHLIDCAHCRAGYEALKAETELLRASVRVHDEALPSHIRPRQADVSWVLVAILVFGTLGISSLWSRYVAPMFDSMENVGIDTTSVATTVLIRSLLWRGWSDMFTTFIQGAVLVASLLLAVYVLYWGWRRLRSSAATFSVLAILACAIAAPTPAGAAEVVLDVEVYTLREGDVIDNDLIIAAEEVRIEGTVSGDLIVAANRVEIVGEVRGDVLGFAETIDILGRVGGNVRTGSRRLQIEGSVDRNVTAAGQLVRLAKGASLGGSFTAAGRDVNIDAPVPRDLLVAAETTEIQARVEGSVLAAGGTLRVGPDGGIGGPAEFHGHREPIVDDGADVASAIEFERHEEEPENPVVSWLTGFFYFWMAAFIFGATLMLAAPEAGEEIITKHIPEYGKSFVHGVIAAVVLFASGVAITITIVGLPLGLTTLFLLGIGLYVAQIYVAAYVGREILGIPTSATAGLGRLALGLLLIQVAKAIPFVSGIVWILVALWGFGAIAAYVLSRYQNRGPAVAVPVEAPA